MSGSRKKGVKMTLTEYLIEHRNYTKEEAIETEIKLENNMPIPEEIRRDINEYFNQYR